MSWIPITTDDVKRRLSGVEYTALTTAALSAGQAADAVAEDVIRDVVKTVRGYVAACARNTLGEGETIPDELLGQALAIVRWNILTRLPDTGLADDPRKAEYDDAMRTLRDVAAGRFTIVSPVVPTADVLPSLAPSIADRAHNFSREDQDGI